MSWCCLAEVFWRVEIPTEVRIAFEALKQDYADLIRLANPLYASVDEK